ncbi:MAG: Multi-sensor signal transduction histidine kinase [Methanoculleus marisnigri]|uniref:histidine kinase n=1 Tax=Methanoculleus marisnigri TaxID=2198 RepID=A0A101GNR2_9EURY|nr:MAG: Multi-sensor signal transduction histidine kinase [Methanoculleus marisnigri]KUL00608.1 MAG: Multi-sensor signal transduction histidine kinase [Methanoculleus marisnigri]
MAPLPENIRILIIGALLGVSVFLTYYFHAVLSVGAVFSHFFYIPIILAALWWGRKGISVAFFLGGLVLISHYLLRIDVGTFNDYGRALMFVVVAVVIATLSERLKRQQKDTERERDRAQGYLDVAAVLLVVINADQTVGLINRRGCELLGYREEELLGKNWFDVAVPERNREDARRAFTRMISGVSAVSASDENVIVTGSGDERTLIWKEAVLRDTDGRVTGILGSGKDITDRIRVEEALRNSEAQLRTIVENLNEGLGVFDLDGNPLHWNRAARDIYEPSGLEIVPGNAEDLGEIFEIATMEGTALPVEEWPLSRILRGEQLRDMEVRTRRIGTDWQRIFNYGGTLVRDADGNLFMAMLTFTDITERKEAEEAIMTANEEANLYLDIMVHDINNVNTVALGYSDILSEDLEGKDREVARKIRSSVRQSIEIIQNVSTIRRLRPPNPVLKPVDLDTVIRAELRQHPETTIRYSGTSVDVRADDLLSEVFTNLLGNSIKFGEPDVVVTIRVEEQDGEVLVSVEDTGPGIPDAIKPTLFSRFRKGKSSRSGKGLGLYIVRMLVERYGGSVRVEDRVPGRPEEGAAFRFTLIKAQEE